MDTKKSWLQRFSLRTKILVGISAILLAFTLLSLFEMRQVVRDFERSIAVSYAGMTDSIGEAIGAQFFERYGDVQAFGVNQVVKRGPPDAISKALDEYVALYLIYDVVLFVDMNGRFISANSKGPDGKPVDLKALASKNYAQEPWFQAVAQGKFSEDKEKGFVGTFVEDVQVDSIIEAGLGQKVWANSFSTLVKDERGNPIGVLTNRANFKWVEGEIKNLFKSMLAADHPTAEVQLLNSKGEVIVNYDPTVANSADVSHDFSILGRLNWVTEGSEAAKLALAGKVGAHIETNSIKSVEQMVGYGPVDSSKFIGALKWHVLVRQDTETLFANLNEQKRNIYFFNAIFALVCLALGAFVATRLNKDLTGVTENLSSLAASNLMTSDELNETAQSVATASTEQGAAVQETVASMSEMRSMIAQTAQHVKECERLSVEVKEKTNQGNHIMQNMVSSMGQIQESNAQLQSLVNIINEINSKTKVIHDIVFKTQLLSFNASIEAARAGQHGRGFAVVAEEVGNLAQLSGNAAKEIEALLQESQKNVGSIIDSVQEKVADGQHVSGEALARFQEIATSVDLIAEKVHNIRQATKEQEIGIDQTAKAMEQMDVTTQANTSISNRTTALATELRSRGAELKKVIDQTEVIVRGLRKDAAYAHFTEHGSAAQKPSTPSSYAASSNDTKDSQNLGDLASRLVAKNKSKDFAASDDSVSGDHDSFKKFGT
jgi:methyl-accepting chemotaxis protein